MSATVKGGPRHRYAVYGLWQSCMERHVYPFFLTSPHAESQGMGGRHGHQRQE